MSALRQPTPPPDPPAVAALPATSREVLDAIRAAYSFTDVSEEAVALSMLAKRPDIAAVLLDALPQVQAIFGDGTRVLLDVIDEHNSEPLRLGARIVTTPSRDARNNLMAFYAAWWNDASGAVLGDLSFGLTYA